MFGKNDSDELGSGLGQPGQREYRFAGKATEWTLVLLQGLAIALIGDLAVVILMGSALILGPVALPIAAGLLVVALAWAAWRWGYTNGVTAFWAGLILACAAVCIARLRAGLLWDWLGDNPKYLALPYGIPWLVACGQVQYRFTQEVLDPNSSPPRMAILRTKPIWPWSPETQDVSPELEEPPTTRHEVRVEVARNGQGSGGQLQYGIFAATPLELRRMAQMILAGASFSEREMTGKGRPLSGRDQFQRIRDEFLRRGWAHWNNPDAPRQGIGFTVVGRKVLEKFAGNGHGDGRETALPQAEDERKGGA